MLHDGRQRDLERLGQRADRQAGLFGETHQQRAPRRVGERGKGAIEWCAAILNHIVKHIADGGAVKRREAVATRVQRTAFFIATPRSGVMRALALTVRGYVATLRRNKNKRDRSNVKRA
jgi:hypothetical protein